MDEKTINGEDFYQVAGGMVLQMKPVNKKEPKGSGLHRLHKAFMCSIEFGTFFFCFKLR